MATLLKVEILVSCPLLTPVAVFEERARTAACIEPFIEEGMSFPHKKARRVQQAYSSSTVPYFDCIESQRLDSGVLLSLRIFLIRGTHLTPICFPLHTLRSHIRMKLRVANLLFQIVWIGILYFDIIYNKFILINIIIFYIILFFIDISNYNFLILIKINK